MKLKTKEELPFKYFVVKKDDTQDWIDYIKWLNKEFKIKEPYQWNGQFYNYYGFDDNKTTYQREYTSGENNVSHFQNNPKLFTAKEFMDLLRVDETLYLEPNICAKFNSTDKVRDLFNKAKEAGITTKYLVERSDISLRINDENILIACINPPDKQISPEEFELRLLNTINKMKENKKIIGYKVPYDLLNGNVKKDQILKPKWDLKDKPGAWWRADRSISETHFTIPFEIVTTWEPVYQEIEETYDMGSFKLKITPDGIFHKNENITSFVHELYSYYGGLRPITKKYGNFTAIESDIIFSKTGCENSETKLSQWIEVWNKYQKLKN